MNQPLYKHNTDSSNSSFKALLSKVNAAKRYNGRAKTFEAIFAPAAMKSAVAPTIRLSRNYPSGSKYAGDFRAGLYWEGTGKYTFPHGVYYTGSFRDSEFYGDGVIRYPSGQMLSGKFVNGKLITWSYEFDDGLEYTEPWGYCVFPDRAFSSSTRNGYKPPGLERITNSPCRPIPEGCYDVGDGFYDPKICCVISAETKKIIRIPTTEEINWAKRHCRYYTDEPVGYRPDLYEHWCTGTRLSVYEVLENLSKEKRRAAGVAEDE